MVRDGVEPEDIDNQMALVAGLTIKAVKGDARAARVRVDLLGEQNDHGAENRETAEDDPITKALKEEAGHGLL